MTRQLVLVHGRAQQQQDPKALKAKWLQALDAGLRKSGLSLPIAEDDVRFPYYGDRLDQVVSGTSPEEEARIIMRGTDDDASEHEFLTAILLEVKKRFAITDEEIAEAAGQDIVERGAQNQPWVLGLFRVLDRRVPCASGPIIHLFTRDVYHYLTRPLVRAEIDDGVRQALEPGTETVVVGHSLGTVVMYNLLRQAASKDDWRVPLFVTVGSPLGITAIRNIVKSAATTRCPPCVTRWFNALDPCDTVALYPLTQAHFPLYPADPAIENYAEVRNLSDNRHAIEGYLSDQTIAREIHDTLS